MRLFIAINFGDAFKDGVCRLQEALRRSYPMGRFTSRENLHLTLAFLGECDEEQLPEIESAMISAAGERFTIVSGRAGDFGHGSVRWLGIEENPQLENLAKRLSSELGRRGFAIEDREFVPHITLGRNMAPPSAPDTAAFPMEKLRQEIRGFELMESCQRNGETAYTPKFSVDFR